MATIKQKHAQAYKDYRTLVDLYGDINDFCGAWCNCDVLELLLGDPTPKQALAHLEILITLYFANNLESAGEIDTKHPDVYEIGKRYRHL